MRRGLTLPELLVSILIIGALATLFFVAGVNGIGRFEFLRDLRSKSWTGYDIIDSSGRPLGWDGTPLDGDAK